MAATAKLRVEICLISARGLPRGPAFLKPQWFAVGWVDPDNKYCTKIDASGSANPTWKTKFSVAIDAAAGGGGSSSELTVEVYKREPVFLGEKLQGTAVIPLKEFLVRFLSDAEAGAGGGLKESGSFQLRKRNSGKPQGFVDVAIAISEKAGVPATSRPGMDERFGSTNKEGVTLAIEDDQVLAFPPRSQPSSSLGDHQLYSNTSHNSYGFPRPPPPYANSPPAAYLKPPTPPPPPPPPPSNVGFVPALFPSAAPLPETYVNLRPSSGTAVRRGGANGAGFGMGLGAGALAAGAVIFGEDFMSGSHMPAGLEGGSLTLSADDTLFCRVNSTPQRRDDSSLSQLLSWEDPSSHPEWNKGKN